MKSYMIDMERKALAKFPSFSWIDFAILPNC